jgi:hypothetical protein
MQCSPSIAVEAAIQDNRLDVGILPDQGDLIDWKQSRHEILDALRLGGFGCLVNLLFTCVYSLRQAI